MKKIILCFLLLLCTTGCAQTHHEHNVIFQDDIQIEYGSEVSSAEFVKRVDSFLINNSMIEENKIHVSNFTVTCPKIKFEKLGTISLIYKINGEEYETFAEVVDTTKPSIELETSDYTFEVGEMKDVKEYYSVSDNYDDEEDIKVSVDGIDKLDINTAGKYELVIQAKDSNGNKSEVELTVTIKDSKKEEEEKKKEEEAKREQEQASSNNSSSNSNSNSSNNQNVQIPVQTPTYTTKDYLFSSGYDMSSAPAACQADLLASGRSGQCIPLQDANGIYYGMRLTLN